MAKNAKGKSFKKPVVNNKKEEPFMEEESNKKMILLILLSIPVLLGLVIGSVYYFNSQKEKNSKPKDNDTEEVERPIEVIEEPIEQIEEQEERVTPVVVVKPVQEVTEEKEEEEEVDYYYLIFVDDKGEQLGEKQKVLIDGEITYPEVEEHDGYTYTWASTCNELENTCTLELVYSKILVAIGEETDNYSIELVGENILVNGTIIYEEDGRESFPETYFHNFIKIKFLAPDGITQEEIENMSVTVSRKGVEGGFTYNGSSLLDSTPEELLENNYYFFLEQAVDEGKTNETPTIVIDWDGDGSLDPVTYTIDLSGIERISFTEHNGIEIPLDEEITGGQTPTYSAELNEDKDKIAIDGTVNNYETMTGNMENMGLDPYKNIITLKFTAPENLTNFDNLLVKTTRANGEEAVYEGPGILDGDNFFYLYQAVDPGITTKNPTITIDWDGEAGELLPETYTIDLTEARMLQNMESEGIEEVENDPYGEQTPTYDLSLTKDVDENNYILVTGDINYYEKGISSLGMEEGNIFVVKFTAPEGVEETDLENMKVTTNVNTYTGDSILDSTEEEKEEGNYYFYHYQGVDEDTNASITIDWDGDAGELEAQTYNFDTTSANLVEPPVTP